MYKRLGGQSATQVGGDCDVHQFRMGELEVVHHFDVGGFMGDLESWVVLSFFSDGRHGPSFVIMGGVHQRIVRELE